jgi:hypothetical protein
MAGDEDRADLVSRLLADPPVVHAMDFSDDPALGVWLSDRDCYEFLARQTGPRSQTLETGSGISTILLGAVGATHTCVTPSQEEADRIVEYCRDRGIGTDSITFAIGHSERVLPTLPASELDLVFIDGCHGFPTPILDWYYGAGRLRRGGHVVVDDLQLAPVQRLVSFLDVDPRWLPVARTEKWAAWRRDSEGSLSEEWVFQPFLPAPTSHRRDDPPWRRVARVPRKILSQARRGSGPSIR